MSEQYVIVGAGHGAGQVVQSLRQEGFEGKIVLIGDEPYLPYQRPPFRRNILPASSALTGSISSRQSFMNRRRLSSTSTHVSHQSTAMPKR